MLVQEGDLSADYFYIESWPSAMVILDHVRQFMFLILGFASGIGIQWSPIANCWLDHPMCSTA